MQLHHLSLWVSTGQNQKRACYLGIDRVHHGVLQELHHDELLQLLQVLPVRLIDDLKQRRSGSAVLKSGRTVTAAGSDPLLVDVGQEEAVLLVQVVVERVVPVLGLNEAVTQTEPSRQAEPGNGTVVMVTHCFWTRSL